MEGTDRTKLIEDALRALYDSCDEWCLRRWKVSLDSAMQHRHGYHSNERVELILDPGQEVLWRGLVNMRRALDGEPPLPNY